MDKLFIKFINHNGYFNTPKDVQLQLRSHPDFPSLRSVTDTLDYFGIENIAANVPKDSLEALPESFLAVLEEASTPYIALIVRKPDKMIVYQEDTAKKILTPGRFNALWTGTVVAVEANEKTQRKTIGSGKVILITPLLLLLAIQAYAFYLPAFLLTLFSLAGVYISYLIVKEEAGFHSRLVAKVCSSVSKNGNCADVINAPAGKLFNRISLSDVCISFFTGSALIYTLLGLNTLFISSLLLLSLPVVLFSLYQQALILKQWCVLCLGVTGILLLQAVIVALPPLHFSFSPAYTLQALFLMLLPYALWQQIKPMLLHYNKLRSAEEDFLRFKRDQNLFLTMLHKNPFPANALLEKEHHISFGAPTPLINIYAVTNPFCGFCTDAFNTYYKLLTLHPDTIRVNFIFNVFAEQKENGATRVAAHILETYATAPEKALNAMNNWFAVRDMEAWQQQYDTSGDIPSPVIALLKVHRQWCLDNEINYTPATILNGYLYPKEYSTTDLLFFIEDMLMETTPDNN